MSVPPPENRQIIKANDDQFYEAKTSATLFSTASLKGEIVALEALLASRRALLAEAAAVGVADAAKLEDAVALPKTP
jgi:hypothetical protein